LEETGGDTMVSSLAIKQQNFYLIDETDIIKDELKWCSVSLSEVVNMGKRFEATIFDIEAKLAREIIVNCKWEKALLNGSDSLLKKSYYPGRFKRIYCDSNNGVPFYLPSQMSEIYPKPEKYISGLTKCNLSELKMKFGDILLTRSGTIGNLTIVSRTLENKIFSDDVIRITCKNYSDTGFLYTYLKSNIGNKILQTNSYGSVITHIEPEHLNEILIPYPPETIRKKINDLIMRSFELRDESNTLIEQATNMLIKELCLPPIREFETDKFDNKAEVDTFSIKLSEIKSRLDASFHIPIVKAITDHLKAHASEVTTVGDDRISKKIILAGVFKRIYVDKNMGIPFLGGREINQLDPQVEKFLSNSHHKARYEKELKVVENMILITDRGTIGEVALVPKHFENWAVSQNILKLVPESNKIAGYCYIFLNSEHGKVLIKHQTYGSVVDMIDNKSLANVPIPLLKNIDIQTKINELALEANAKRYEAYKLEQQAMQIMNNEVIFAK